MKAQIPGPGEIQEIAERAYIYGYPLVLLEATLAPLPVNQLTHVSAFPDASFRLIVRPNADTLYTNAWFDVFKEPMLLHIADSGGRFYLLQFMDAWTETFADPGKRTTGTGEGWFAIVGPGWKGKLPPNVTRLDAPTNQVWLLRRTQTNGATDYGNVHAFQRGMRLLPLSEFPGAGQTDCGRRRYIDHHNRKPKPFLWTASARDILEKVTRARRTLDKRQKRVKHSTSNTRHWASRDTTSSGTRIITDLSHDSCSSRPLLSLSPVFAASV